MNWNDLEIHFSAARLGRYSAARDGDKTKAAADYSTNLLLSEAMVPMLNVLEIALRNGIHVRLSKLYGRRDWWEAWKDERGFNWQNKQVSSAKEKLRRHNEPQTVDKVLAELTFGFWSSLFNTQLQSVLWKDLRLVFARCPKQERQRQNISSALNQIRDLRNRVFHHEPLIWLTPELLEQHQVGVRVINWLDPQLSAWLERYDRLPAAWTAWKAEG
ncbi:Abi-like protein [compost metagenome]